MSNEKLTSEDVLIMSCHFLGSLTLFFAFVMKVGYSFTFNSVITQVIAGSVLNFLFYNMKHS